MRVGDLGGLAQGTGDVAVDEAEDGDCAEGDGDGGAGGSRLETMWLVYELKTYP